jgi:methyl coenzyme M reductase subunit C-like uncharacterized protein (methanogenesis marker protein 7)
MAVYKGASFNDSVNIIKLDVFEGANIRLTTTLATAEITTLNVSGEAYVGGKSRWKKILIIKNGFI